MVKVVCFWDRRKTVKVSDLLENLPPPYACVTGAAPGGRRLTLTRLVLAPRGNLLHFQALSLGWARDCVGARKQRVAAAKQLACSPLGGTPRLDRQRFYSCFANSVSAGRSPCRLACIAVIMQPIVCECAEYARVMLCTMSVSKT